LQENVRSCAQPFRRACAHVPHRGIIDEDGHLATIAGCSDRGRCARDFLTTVDSAGLHYYYIERADRVLAFSFIVGGATDQPEGPPTRWNRSRGPWGFPMKVNRGRERNL
jgi:hypothetical protein